MVRFYMILLLTAAFAASMVTTATADLGTGLGLYSPMDDITPSIFNGYWEDASGNGYHVNNVAAPAYDGGGARSTAVECDASNDTLMSLFNGQDSALDPGLTDYTVSCWAYQTTAGIAWIVEKGAYVTGVESGFSFLSINGIPSFRLMGVGGTSSEQITLQAGSVNLTDGWHHMVGVIDRTGATGAANTANFYVDGTLAQSLAIPDVGGSAANISDPGENFLMGGRPVTTYKYGGYLDDVALYSGALSSTDVQTLYNTASLDAATITSSGISPLLIQNFENMRENTPGVVPDVVSGNDGVPSFTAERTDATRGQVIDFSSSDTAKVDYGEVGDPMDQSQTVSLWFKTDDATGTQILASKGNSSSAYPAWSVFLSDADLFVRANCTPIVPEAEPEKTATWTTITQDEWHHLALVIDNDNGVLKGYIDGQSSGSAGSDNGWNCDGRGGADTVAFTAGSVFDSESSLLLGLSEGGAAPFNGQIDDFAIWNRVLSDAEILAISNGAPISASDLLPGDANYDGVVNAADAAILADNWQTTDGTAIWSQGDFNGDGNVDDIDATLLAANWQVSASASVPEPGTIAMIITALVACFVVRKIGENKRP